MAANPDFEIFVCGKNNTRDVEAWSRMTEGGRHVAGNYLALATLIETHGQGIVQMLNGDNTAIMKVFGIDPESDCDEESAEFKEFKAFSGLVKSESGKNLMAVAEKIAAFRQMLATVHGINKPKFGLVMANLFEEEIAQVVEAAKNGVEKTPVKRRDGLTKKDARVQSQEMLNVLNAFLAGKLSYTICFVVSRAKNEGKQATVLMSVPRSMTEFDEDKRIEQLLPIASIELETVYQPNTPHLPDGVEIDSEIVQARLQSLEIYGTTPRTTTQLKKVKAIVLKTLLRSREVLQGFLLDGRGTAFVVSIQVRHGSTEPICDFLMADALCKTEQELGREIDCFNALTEALQSWEDLEDDDLHTVQTRIDMAKSKLDELHKTFDKTKRYLDLLESNEAYWGEHQRPIIVVFEDIMPHAPIWFKLRAGADDTNALHEEIYRLHNLYMADGDIPEPPRPRTYAEVVSDSG